MSRELKFKCWLPGIKKMSYSMPLVYLINITEGIEGICYLQYTGLKDRNGKEIYEGDIVESLTTSFQQYNTAKVVFANGGFQFYLPNGSIVLSVDTTVYKVIGNIYETPELINNKLIPQ